MSAVMRNKKKNQSKRNQSSSRSAISFSVVVCIVFIAAAAICIAAFYPSLEHHLENLSLWLELGAGKETLSKAQQKHAPEINLGAFDIAGYRDISVKKWKKKGRFLRELVQLQQPTLLTDGPASTWPLYNLDLLKLGKNASSLELKGTRWLREKSVFLLGHEREKGGMISTRRNSSERLPFYTRLSLLEFLDATFDLTDYFYWTGELSTWENSSEVKAMFREGNNATAARLCQKPGSALPSDGWEGLKIVEKGLEHSLAKKTAEEEEDLWRPMLWLSHPGVVAQTHYDTQHNLFVQLQGTKVFYLFSPDVEIYQYPNIHQSYRQSQLHFESSVISSNPGYPQRFPRFRNCTAYRVILSPGDMLYIPPYWAHRVESVTLSLSLSVLSPSLLEAILAEAYWQKVPFGGLLSSSRGHRVTAVVAYLSIVMEEVHRKADANSEGTSYDGNLSPNSQLVAFARDLFHARFEPLYDTASLRQLADNVRRPETSVEPSSYSQESDLLFMSHCGRFSNVTIGDVFFSQTQASGEGFDGAASLGHMSDAAKRVAGLLREATRTLRDPGSESLSDKKSFLTDEIVDEDSRIAIKKSITNTFLRDYFEQLVRWAVGPDLTPLMIFECLGFRML